MKICAISGSLRKESYNTALLKEAARFGHEVSFAAIEMPLFNSDIEKPAAATQLEEAIRSADVVLVSTPEYNYSIPGVLKNAIDWTSMPTYNSVWAEKPIGIIGAAMSVVGTARAQAHLRQVLFGVRAHVFPNPEFIVGACHKKFADGKLQDEKTIDFFKQYLDKLQAWKASFKI